MKPIQLLFCISILMLSSAVMAQDSLSQKKALIIKADLLFPVASIDPEFGGGSLTVELGVKRRHSFQLTGLMAKNGTPESLEKLTQIIPAYKYFFSKKRAYTGFYSGVYLKGEHARIIIDPHDYFYTLYAEYTQNTLGGGLLVGYQNYIKKRIVIDFVFGMGVRHEFNPTMITNENYIPSETNSNGTDAIIALNIGYKF